MAETIIENETFNNLLALLKIENYAPSPAAKTLLDTNARYIKDLKINVSNVLNNSQNLSKKEATLLAYSIAVNEKFPLLREGLATLSEEAGATSEEIAETVSATSLMNVNNVFYRFRHFAGNEFYNNQPAGIKMSIMVNPVLGRELFELISLAVSSVNGCEMCVKAHESKLIGDGTPEIKIFEAVKLAAVIKGLITVLAA